jgi:tRNA-dihydrouridine synthase
VGNGDIRSWEDFERAMEEARPKGVMIGREAARRPWIFALIRGLEADPGFELEVDLRAVAFDFLDLLEARLPPDFHESRAKRFFFWFADNFTWAHLLRTRLQKAPNTDRMRHIRDEYVAEVPGDLHRREGRLSPAVALVEQLDTIS